MRSFVPFFGYIVAFYVPCMQGEIGCRMDQLKYRTDLAFRATTYHPLQQIINMCNRINGLALL